jgi:ADP-ribose pyrophosphatase YjhB (NUDIX family)
MADTTGTHPSVKFKYCPACASAGFTFNGEKLFTCSSCGFTFYVNPAAAVAAIIESPDGRIVLTRRKHEPRSGSLDLPGGFVDINESAEEAIRREVFEELGINIKSLRLLASFPNEYIFNGLKYFTCDLGFICTTDELEKIKPADDVSEAILIDPDDISFAEIGFPSIVNLLKSYIKQKS